MSRPAPACRLDGIVAANIRQLLKSSDLRQNQLAVAVRLSPTELSQRMTGKVSFEVDVVEDIAMVLDIDPADLFTEPDGGRV